MIHTSVERAASLGADRLLYENEAPGFLTYVNLLQLTSSQVTQRLNMVYLLGVTIRSTPFTRYRAAAWRYILCL